jgi:hypothetical protein
LEFDLMKPSLRWARNFSVEKQDIEYLTNLLLERETPLDTETLARALIQERINKEAAVLRERYEGARLYNPSLTYAVGQRVIFTEFDYATAVVQNTRIGNNTDYGEFTVIGVKFDSDDLNTARKLREFASALTASHALSETDEQADTFLTMTDLDLESIMEVAHDEIVEKVANGLKSSADLIHMARKWFPRDLLMDANIGHLNLAEAVLDIAGGGPMQTSEMIEQIGGLGKAPLELQIFSLNYALNKDSRFDEVGPSGEVLWHLTRLEPQDVQQTPPMLRYTPIDYDRSILSAALLALESEIEDEHSAIDPAKVPQEIGTVTIPLTYPHRRLGTLPLSQHTSAIFPTARQTPRVWFTLVDGQDGEEYPAWAVRKDRYVFGLGKFYRKHKLPIGAYVSVEKSGEPGKVIVNFRGYKPRTEWIRLIVPKQDGGITFENQKRAIGAEYDELMILGADDLAGVDAAFQTAQHKKSSLASILRNLIPPLGALTPQGTVHAKTLYSTVNILRRCPPGPIFATLTANPDFQNVGGDYWKLSGD